MQPLIAPLVDETDWVRDTWSRYARRFAEQGGPMMRLLHADFVEASLRDPSVIVFVAREPQHGAHIGWLACEPNVMHYVYVEREWWHQGVGKALVRHVVEHGPLSLDWRPTHLTEAGRCFIGHLAEVGLYRGAKAPQQARHGEHKSHSQHA